MAQSGKPAKRPSREELANLQDQYTAVQIAGMFNVAERTVRAWIAQDKAASEAISKQPTPPPAFPDLKKPVLDWREAIDLAMQMQDLNAKAEVGQHEATARIAVDKPVTIVFSSDWHLGSMATDHKTFMAHIEYILRTDGLYIGVVGDEIDNFSQFKSAAAVLGQVLHPDRQRDVLVSILKELVTAGKLLFTSWGNHNEGFDERILGSSLKSYLYNHGVPHLKDDGRVALTVGKQTYLILAKHLARYNSAFNKTWGPKQLFRMEQPADIVVVGHTHVSDFETYYHYDRQNFLFRLGTFKTEDSHSRRYYGRPQLGTPAAVLFPDRREIVPFLRVDQAEQYMRACWQENRAASRV